jgi:hypothetical protein
MEDKVTIYLYREATNQLMIVSGDNAKEGYKEIKNALLGDKLSNDVGLIGSDFRIEIIKPNSKIETYNSYGTGNLLMDNNYCYIFNYGKAWYDALESQLKKILKDDPYHFMKEEKDRNYGK